MSNKLGSRRGGYNVEIKPIDNKVIQVSLLKLKEADEPLFLNNIKEGYQTSSQMFERDLVLPSPGLSFSIPGFKTSMVVAIIDGNTFETLNSIYRWTASEVKEKDIIEDVQKPSTDTYPQWMDDILNDFVKPKR